MGPELSGGTPMPDWFYRTVSRPLLFGLPAAWARDFSLGLVGTLARLPAGPAVIDFLGHMRPDPRLARTLLGIPFPTAVGLGPWLDVRAAALPALARFGFGFLEVGPVRSGPPRKAGLVRRRTREQALWYSESAPGIDIGRLLPRLAAVSRLGVPVIARLGYAAGADPGRAAEECAGLLHDLASRVAAFSLHTLRPALAAGWPAREWAEHMRLVRDAARQAAPARPLLLCVPADADPDKADPFVEAALAAGVPGLLVDGSVPADPAGRLVGLPAREPALRLVRHLRRRWGDGVMLIGSGGVHEPQGALEMREAGADLVEVDSGLVYTGPGLPKRINDALLFPAARAAPPAAAPRPAEMTWLWAALMGVGMFLGGLLALAIAATAVVLPYDESFVGLSREGLGAINPRLLAFMAHDRVTLAGTMVAIGVMYLGLSLGGVRRGLHWARQAVYWSAFTGFASFFLFLGFGYLDTFHAFVTAAMLQLLLLAVHCKLGVYVPGGPPELRGGWRWRLGLWGQFLLVLHGFALLAAGLAISAIGVTRVFVPEDLEFMRTTAASLRAANPRLVPLIAHDRATVGGMLLAGGWAFLLPALWGCRRGQRWLWWSLLLGGLSAYVPAIGVHFAVGYTNLHHLLPAFAGLGLFVLGLGLLAPHLFDRGREDEAAWGRFLGPGGG
jgi:hypothetical protein